MTNKKISLIFLLLFLSIIITGCINEQTENSDQINVDEEKYEYSDTIPTGTDTIYQFSVIDALLEGVYDGEMNCGELKTRGDFGLGTFDNLNGEMLELEGVIYQVRADGNVCEINDSETSPFAVVTFFENDIEKNLDKKMTGQQVAAHIEELLPSRNIMYAIKINGEFEYMKTRSVAAQEKPYPRLIEVTEDQSVFEFNDTKGTIVGYWMPEYIEGINVPGYHLHFITEDRTGGGHVLDYTLTSGTIEIDRSDRFYLELPENENYLSKGFSADTEDELEEAEN